MGRYRETVKWSRIIASPCIYRWNHSRRSIGHNKVANFVVWAAVTREDLLARKKKPVMNVPTDLDFEKSLIFFHAYMYGPLQGRARLYKARGIPLGSVAQPSDWEVLASMIVKDIGRKIGSGIDLANYEVKSAKRGGSFEYQYHKNTGKGKLRKDMECGHLFFEHDNNLKDVKLRYVHGSEMTAPFFRPWLRQYPNPYPQRYRKNVPYTWVLQHGVVLMTLEEGEVIFPPTKKEAPPTSIAPEEAAENN